MNPHRRTLLAGIGLSAVAAGTTAVAQTPPAKPKPPLGERLMAEAEKHRWPVSFDGGTASGPGFERLVSEGEAARFFLVGEEHGLAQVPALVGSLLTALKPAGYSRLGVEVSPPGARALDQAARGGVEGLRRFYAESPPGPAFYTMREEAEMLARVRAAFPGERPLLFGLDYEVLLDRMLIAALGAKAPASAGLAMAALESAADDAWAAYEKTRDIGKVFSFSGDPALVRAVRAAWKRPDPASEEILETLEQTLVINRHQTQKRYFQSNDSRAQFNRANWAKLWAVEGGDMHPAQPVRVPCVDTLTGDTHPAGCMSPPKMMFKFGAGHMVRGRSMTEVYDIASLVSETAALRGEHSFHLLVVPLDGRQAALNPETMRYVEAPVSTIEEMALEPLVGAVLPGVSTLIDLRPLRPLMSASVTQTADPRLARVVHGYDAVLFVRDARASGNL